MNCIRRREKRIVEWAVGIALAAFSTPGNAQWSRVGFPDSPIGALLVKGDTILAGHQDQILVSTDEGGSWDSLARVSTLALSAFTSYGDTILAATDRARGCFPGPCDPLPSVFRSTDGGKTWDPVLVAIYGATSLQRSGNAFYTNADKELFRSDQSGIAWDEVPPDTSIVGPVDLVFVHRDTLFIETRERGLQRSSDVAETWTEINTGLPGTSVFSMAGYNESVFAVPVGHGVFRSTNSGFTWSPFNEGLHSFESVNLLVSGSYGLIAAASDTVYYRPHSGPSWLNITGDLRPQGFAYVSCLAVSEQYLFAGTNDGIWRRSLSGFVTSAPRSEPIPDEYAIHNNYPNPFNSSTTITYDLPVRSEVALEVFDGAGQNVHTVAKGVIEAGRHQVIWNAGGMPSGVYFARLRVRGSPALIRRMVLVK